MDELLVPMRMEVLEKILAAIGLAEGYSPSTQEWATVFNLAEWFGYDARELRLTIADQFVALTPRMFHQATCFERSQAGSASQIRKEVLRYCDRSGNISRYSLFPELTIAETVSTLYEDGDIVDAIALLQSQIARVGLTLQKEGRTDLLKDEVMVAVRSEESLVKTVMSLEAMGRVYA